MVIKNGQNNDATEYLTSFGRIIARQNYIKNISDETNGYFRTEKYSSATGDTGTTGSFYVDGYVITSPGTSAVVRENLIFSRIPDSMVIYASGIILNATNITVDISQTNGSAYPITAQPLDTYIDTTSFTGSGIGIRFNLTTVNGSATPKLFGWSAVITDD